MDAVLKKCAETCVCGKRHPLAVREVRVGHGVLSRMSSLLHEGGWERPVVISDENTRRIAGDTVASVLPTGKQICLNPEKLHADEHGVQAVEDALAPDADVLLAVGAGTIHDITRYVAHKRGIPFIAVPTAASVDGFVSNVAAMTWHGCKQTFPAVAPVAVLADTDIFTTAPSRLTAAGVGDMLGKYIALADWRIAHLVTDEYLCENVFQMEHEALEQVVANLDIIISGGDRGSEVLMRGLLLSGLAMQMVGNSRPASGAEHHLSHLWEMEVLNPPLDALHGEKVGVGLLLCLRAYAAFKNDLRLGRLVPRPYGGLDLERIRKYFNKRPGMADQIIAENSPSPLVSLAPERLMELRPEIIDVLDALPDEARLTACLRAVGGKTALSELGLPDHVVDLSLRLAPYARSRLTLLRICYLFDKHPVYTK